MLKVDKNGKKLDIRANPQSPVFLPKKGPRAKRSGVDAVKLHLQVTGGTGRTSRSATAVKLFYLNTNISPNLHFVSFQKLYVSTKILNYKPAVPFF